MTKNNLLIALGLIGGFALSFLGVGLLWVGLKTPIQCTNAILFFLLSYLLTKFLKKSNIVFGIIVAGAAPLASILVRFRDSEGSHLMPFLVVTSWAAGTFLGSKIGSR